MKIHSLKQYHDRALTYPDEFPKTILQQIELQKEMLAIYDFIPEIPQKICDWIEKFGVITEGEKSGQKVELLLWQKWLIFSIFGFYGNIDTEVYDTNGDLIEYEKKYLRIVNDAMLIIASGNAKTTTFGMILTALMHLDIFNNPNIFIGSTSKDQSRICYQAVRDTIQANKILSKYNKVVDSRSTITNTKTGAVLKALSSDSNRQEGIIPAVIVIDELHVMKTSAYAEKLRKSTKRDDMLILESSTHGMERSGYLDKRLDYARSVLSGQTTTKNYRCFFAIYEQENENDILEAYNNDDYSKIKKSNPSLGFAVKVNTLKDKINTMLNDPHNKNTVLTFNFNIPTNAVGYYFSPTECQTKPFNEDILYNAPVFIGLDMAYTRSPEDDLVAIDIMTVNPFTNDEYHKTIFLLPKYYQRQTKKDDGSIEIENHCMIRAKSKVDTNIEFNDHDKIYGYERYTKKGDLVIVDEALVDELVSIYGEQAFNDCTGMTQEFVFFYIAHLERKYSFMIMKAGIDPNKANFIETMLIANCPSYDTLPVAVKFQMEKKNISNPIIEMTKDIRRQQKVFNNSKLQEMHFASVMAKETRDGFVFENEKRRRKDGVIAELGSKSAYVVFTTNHKTGARNLEMLKGWWIENEEAINSKLAE